MNSRKPDRAIDLFYRMWIQQLGMPSEIWRDRGAAFIGICWGAVFDFLDMQMILISRERPFENGMAGRPVGMIKTPYRIMTQNAHPCLMKDH